MHWLFFKEIAVLSVTVYLAVAPQDQMRCMENEKCQQQHYKQEISIEILHWNFYGKQPWLKFQSWSVGLFSLTVWKLHSQNWPWGVQKSLWKSFYITPNKPIFRKTIEMYPCRLMGRIRPPGHSFPMPGLKWFSGTAKLRFGEIYISYFFKTVVKDF